MANNVNNGITGVIDIPGALRSRGAADGNLVGGVVAYAGDIYDVTAGKNQATLNAEFAEGITNASSSSFSGNYNDLSDIPLLRTAENGFKVDAHGRKNTASAQDSFAEGAGTTASGQGSHSEGDGTIASGTGSHAEGSGYYIHAYVHSAYTAGDTTIILERRVYPGQYLSRRQNERYDAVKVSDVYSHPSNPGIFEVSLEEGFSANLAYHNYVYIFGGALDYGSHAEGEGCTANGSGSHAEGAGTTAFGLGTHSEGDETLAYGGYAHSEGKETLAYGDYSHAEGSETNAREGGHSEGNKTYAYGDYSHAEGHQTLAYGNYSHAEGKGYDKTVTVGSNYVARQTTIDLLSPVAPGQFLAITDNINKYRYGETELIKILGCQEDTNNLGHYIVTLQYGMNNSVNAGDTLHIYSAASGSYSHSEGNNTSASGDYSHAEGVGTETTNAAEHASGKYNQSTPNATQFSVGIGADAEHRANAFEVDVNGNIYIQDIGNYDGTSIADVDSLQTVITDVNTRLSDLEGIVLTGDNIVIATSPRSEFYSTNKGAEDNVIIGRAIIENTLLVDEGSFKRNIIVGNSNKLNNCDRTAISGSIIFGNYNDVTGGICIGANNTNQSISEKRSLFTLLGNRLKAGDSNDITYNYNFIPNAIVIGVNNNPTTFNGIYSIYRNGDWTDAGAFEVGAGKNNTGVSILAQKSDGNLYIKGVGGWDGMSSVKNKKSINTIISEFETRIAALESQIAALTNNL